MCSFSVLCPLCHQTSFSSIDALRCSLIKAANGPSSCPICHELFLGLDKLTIHLFSHTHIMNANESPKQQASGLQNTLLPPQPPPTSPLPSTTTLPANISKNNNNNNSPIIKDNNSENFKTEDRLLPSSLDGAPTTANSPTKQELLSNEVNFENTHHGEQQQLTKTIRTAATKCKNSKADKNKTSKKSQVSLANISEERNVVSMIPEILHSPPPHPPPLAVIEEKSCICDICEFAFRNEELKNMHIRLVHQNFVYPQPLEKSNTNSSTDHLANSQTEMDFKCHLCSKTFKMKGSLRVHLKVVHLMGLPYVNNSPKLSICERIRHKESKQMKSARSSNVLTLTESPADTQSKPQNNNQAYNLQPIAILPNMSTSSINSTSTLANLSVVNITPTEYNSSSIEISNAPLQNSNVLLVLNSSNNTHITQAFANLNTTSVENKDQNTSTIAIPGTTYLAPPVPSTTTVDNPKIWECDVCSKAFTTKYFLKKHKRLHTGEMPYTCEICGRTFTFQQSYHKHLLYHSDEKPHVCSTCGRAFKELSTLHNHERIHSGEKPFKCDVCGKSFRQRVSFLVHTRIHTGVMPYKCEFCQKSFRYKVSQRTHKCQAPFSNEEIGNLPNEALDHISENFIKAFLENSTNSLHLHQQQQPPTQNSPSSNEIASITEKIPTPLASTHSSATLNEHQALLSKAIDDIVVESCNKLGIGNRCDSFSPVQNDVNEGSMSPSQKLQNMRLYSPQLTTPDLNGIEGELTRFFMENTNAGQNIM
ncbi:uncharacterized protein LOC142220123 [Haematobia irritans]|uniref:uncharacterized protein LOC142220123 n=1 Tax=Haematobia irritans TaxID=7368 RepID=UPI003F50168E